MDFKELIRTRESCRNYSLQPVEKEKLEVIIEAASLAPSACNSQPWRYIVVNEKSLAEKMPPLLKRNGINGFTDNVSCFVVVCETEAKLMPGASCDSQHYAQMDIGLSTAYLTLSATTLGLSTCILGCFNEEEIKKLLLIPEDIKIRLVVAVGYASENKTRNKVRKPLTDICSYNCW